MPDDSIAIPEGYEIVRIIGTSGSVGECIARHQADDVLVRLRVFNFTQTSGPTTRRHYREHLRNDITFMEELEQPGVIRLFDYSDTKGHFWIATQPAEVDKLSERFDFLASQPFEFRQGLVHRFLAILQGIHNSHVVHRNLCSDIVFLTPEDEVLIGGFSFAGYLADRPTMRLETNVLTNATYLPPEIKNAETFDCSVNSDIFSAGLLTYEILSAASLPKDASDDIHATLRVSLSEQISGGNINMDTADVILRAANPSPERRWPTADDFANALEASLRGGPARSTASAGQTATIAITEPAEPEDGATFPVAAETAQWPGQTAEGELDAADAITPIDPSHEIWNNHYEIMEKIGEGGQAIVYRAYDHLTNEEIAIKTIWARHRRDRAAINRLKQGAMIARSLTHRHIIKTYSVEQRAGVDSLDKQVFIVMELIGSRTDLGHPIEMRKTSEQKFGLHETLHIIRQLLDALSYAHEYTIHRDIKPGNIMLVPRDKETGIDTSDLTKFDIKLIDFGIAKVLSQKHIDVTGKGFRSAYYGAPELADARVGVDARADVYSVGVIIYQMLTKSIPRKGSPPANKVNKSVPAALANVIDRAINTDREKRFRTTSDFAKEIERAVSRFNWVRKAAKIAAVLLVCAAVAGAVERLLPEPNYGSVQGSMEILEGRDPNRQIAVLADNTPVKYSDIEGYGSYDQLKQTALDNLKIVESAGSDRFNMRRFSPWREQEKVWLEIEPDINKVERIAQDQREYSARKDLAVVTHLMDPNLTPSSGIVSEVTSKAEDAERLLAARPLARDSLEICADSYDSAARIYANIQALAGESDTPEIAGRINDKLKNVEELRNASLVSRSSLEVIEELKDIGFLDHSDNCFEKADKYYHTFELDSATQYFSLLGQICGTMAHVRDEIDFGRSDMGLISSRLMDLCHEDIEAFENYPAWKEKLEQVYRKKDVAAKYNLIRSLLLKSPKDVPLAIWDTSISALREYRQGNLDSAAANLADAFKQYEESMGQRISALMVDCASLLTFPTVPAENIENCRKGLDVLLQSLEDSPWPQTDFADEYNRCSTEITKQKDAVREQLIEDALEVKRQIVDSKNKASQQSYFWESRQIGKYAAFAEQYDSEDIDASIANWKFVEDLRRLSDIVNQMRGMDSLLDEMFARKDKLDLLSANIDEAIAFCEKFKGISSEERQKYKQFGLALKQLKTKLTTQQDGVFLIDQPNRVFVDGYAQVHSAFAEIRDKLPYHRSRVIELINKTHSLEETVGYLGDLQQHWAGVLSDANSIEIKPDFAKTRLYLDSVKEDVDNWPADRFNQQMQDKCRTLADAIQKQSRAVAYITSAILNAKSRLIEGIESFVKKVNEILSDEDIRDLDAIAAANEGQALLQFRQVPDQLGVSSQKLSAVVIDSFEASTDVVSISNTAGFEVDIWLPLFNADKDRLDNQVSQLQAIEEAAPIFRETGRLLARQSSMETDYYLALRDSAVDLIDYSDVSGLIDAAATDKAIIRMCGFLDQIQNDTVPRLSDFKTSVAAVSRELTNLKSAKIGTISEAKDFNRKRKQLLDNIAALRRDVRKLDKPNLENSCKQAVTQAVDEIKNLIGTPGQSDTLDKIASSLWAFMIEHKEWEQWTAFLKLHHLVLSGDEVSLTSSKLLRPANEEGVNLGLAEIARSPKAVFNNNTSQIANFGWPRYLSHQNDPTIILAFVLATESSGLKPFYMATREISNAQYKLFMTKTGAGPTTDLPGWSYFSDQDNECLIGQTQAQFPPCRITWDKPTKAFILDENFKNDPVAWVTFHGAQAYAQWLGANVPTVSQHAYATRAGADTLYPWGDQLEGILSYAHVRSATWQKAARDYNAKRDNPVEIAYPPVGAIRDFLREKALDPARIVHAQDNNLPIWPCFTQGNKPNAWGLYDLIGNAWEWCIDTNNDSTPLICGGSCLCPPEYVGPESKTQFNTQACDVGFRIIIPAK